MDNDGCFWAWTLSEGEQFPAQLEEIESEITRHFVHVAASKMQCVTAVTKDQNYLVEKRPGQWARAVVRKKFQSSKAFAEWVPCLLTLSSMLHCLVPLYYTDALIDHSMNGSVVLPSGCCSLTMGMLSHYLQR